MDSEDRKVFVAVARQLLREIRSIKRWRIFFRIIFVLIVVSFFGLIKGSSTSEKNGYQKEHIAVVKIIGAIDSNSDAGADAVNPALLQAFKSPKSKAVLLSINSPGGSPIQAGRIYRELTRLKQLYKKPVYSVIDEIGASAAYYIASASDEIWADPASLVGSIGVISQNYGINGLIEKIGVEKRVFTAGEHKDFLDNAKPLKEDEVNHMNEQLRILHNQFIDAVKKGRKDKLVDPEKNKLFSGLFWVGERSLSLGLVDNLGDADDLSRKLGDLPLVNYSVKKDVLSNLKKSLTLQVSDVLTKAIDQTAKNITEQNNFQIR